jgi:predicted DsbA family dithiol-disulfide isomerase
MESELKIDIVSDISCPWCIIGFKALQTALQELAPAIQASIEWQPFELTPLMPQEGQEINEHLTQKYQITDEQVAQNREAIKQRGLDVGYEFGNRGGGRIYNTFDAHRLLHWAKLQGKQTALKLALIDLYFKSQRDPSDHEQLLNTAELVGLDRVAAKQILESTQYESDVRQLQQRYQSAGVQSVPAVIINNKHLISGGQPASVFRQALTQIASEM